MPWLLDHVSITVADLDRAAPFWDAVTAALGIPCVVREPGVLLGYGVRSRPGDSEHAYLSIVARQVGAAGGATHEDETREVGTLEGGTLEVGTAASATHGTGAHAIGAARPDTGASAMPDRRHWALRAASAEAVDRFHAAGLAAGGTCDGPPGPRPRYHPGYYAAFLLDPSGNRIEAVCHDHSAGPA